MSPNSAESFNLSKPEEQPGQPLYVEGDLSEMTPANDELIEAEYSIESQNLIEEINTYLNEAEAVLNQGDQWAAAVYVEKVPAAFRADITLGLLPDTEYRKLADRYRIVAASIYGATGDSDILESARRKFFDRYAENILKQIDQQSVADDLDQDVYSSLRELSESDVMMSHLTPEIKDKVIAVYEPLKRLMHR